MHNKVYNLHKRFGISRSPIYSGGKSILSLFDWGYDDTPDISQNLFGINVRNIKEESVCLDTSACFSKTYKIPNFLLPDPLKSNPKDSNSLRFISFRLVKISHSQNSFLKRRSSIIPLTVSKSHLFFRQHASNASKF